MPSINSVKKLKGGFVKNPIVLEDSPETVVSLNEEYLKNLANTIKLDKETTPKNKSSNKNFMSAKIAKQKKNKVTPTSKETNADTNLDKELAHQKENNLVTKQQTKDQNMVSNTVFEYKEDTTESTKGHHRDNLGTGFESKNKNNAEYGRKTKTKKQHIDNLGTTQGQHGDSLGTDGPVKETSTEHKSINDLGTRKGQHGDNIGTSLEKSSKNTTKDKELSKLTGQLRDSLETTWGQLRDNIGTESGTGLGTTRGQLGDNLGTT